MGNIIDIKYDEYDKVVEFLKTIKTNLLILVTETGDKTVRITLKNKQLAGNKVVTY